MLPNECKINRVFFDRFLPVVHSAGVNGSRLVDEHFHTAVALDDARASLFLNFARSVGRLVRSSNALTTAVKVEA